MNTRSITAIVACLLSAAVVDGQTTKSASAPSSVPSSAPTSAPASAPARHEAVIPSGFVKTEISERTALSEPADRDWIKGALTDLNPTTRPTTMPSDLLDVLARKRGDILKQATTDLGLSDPSALGKSIEENLIPNLQKMAELRPPLFYMVASKQRFLDLMRGGWSDPGVRYNRFADEIAGPESVIVSVNNAMDDMVIPVAYDAEDAAQKKKLLQEKIDLTEARIAASLSTQGQFLLQSGYAHAIDDAVIKPLLLKPNQTWFGIGVAGRLSIRYMAMISGLGEEDLKGVLLSDDARNPIRSRSLDLLHPSPVNELRAGYPSLYVGATRIRSVVVVDGLLTRGGPDALAKSIAAIKSAPPANGEALVELIKTATGVDLSEDVVPPK